MESKDQVDPSDPLESQVFELLYCLESINLSYLGEKGDTGVDGEAGKPGNDGREGDMGPIGRNGSVGHPGIWDILLLSYSYYDERDGQEGMCLPLTI